jgi:hypothetical protein
MTLLLMVATLTIVNALILLGGIGVLWIVIKIYSEVLKIGHIKNIGKAA